MRTELVPLHEVNDLLQRQWQELARSALESNPFFEPEFVMNAAALPGSPDVALLVVHDDVEALLIIPVQRLRSYRRMPVPALSTWNHDYCLLGTPLLTPTESVAVLREAIRFLVSERIAPWMVIEGISAEGPTAAALSEALADEGIKPVPLLTHARETVNSVPGRDVAPHSLSTKTTKALRRQRRRLAAEMGRDITTSDAALGSDLDGMIDAFLRAEASGWKAVDGGAFLRRPGHADFFRAVCRDFAADGRLQFYVLGATGAPVAFQCNLISQDRVFNFKIAYDDDYRRFSPGLMVDFDGLDDFNNYPELTSMDSCLGANAQPIHRFLPDTMTVTTLLVPLRQLRGHAAARYTPTLNAAGRRLHAWEKALEEKRSWKKPR